MWQIPDYVWSVEGQPWIGDAKWKSLTDKTGAEEAESEIHISATDIRQLTTYAALFQAKQKNMTGRTPELAIFYPRIGAAFSTRRHRTWNDSRLHVVPIRVSGWSSPADVLPVDFSLTK
jgi:5-methylcytosine-specific restriction endonuclease McrBC regulatory subunit McrC